MKPILGKAARIVAEHGLDPEAHGANQQIHTFLNARIDELNQKEWVIRIDDRYFKVREQLTRVIRNVVAMKDLVTTAASSSPPAALACAGVTVCLLLFIQAADQKDSLLQGLEATSGLIARLDAMEGLYLKSETNVPADFMVKFKAGLISLYCKILEFQARALYFLRKSSFVQASRNALKLDQWDALKASIMSQDVEAQNFMKLIDAANRRSDCEKISLEFDRALKRHQVSQTASQRFEKVKILLKTLNLCPYRDRKDRVDDRVLETCEWFTGHSLFQKWDQNDGSRLLWVSADPGCGKSVLSKYLVDEVLPSARKRKICYFFFRDDYPDQRTSAIALASLIRQILMAQPSLITDSVLDKMDQEGERLAESFRSLWDLFMDLVARKDVGEIVCVLDALDECRKDDRNELIGCVRDYYLDGSNDHKLKFLLTSRPYGEIRAEFQELEDQMPSIHLNGEGKSEIEKISGEINLVIRKRVADMSRKKRLEHHEQEFLQEKLTASRNRTYLWVTLTLSYISGLDGFTKGNVRQAMHDLPDSVDTAYEKILGKSKDHHRARHLLHLILAAKRPFSVEELALAMAFRRCPSHDQITEETEPTERFRATLRDLCGLMTVVVDDKVYLLHQTVKEFLVQSTEKSPSLPSPISWNHKFSVVQSNRLLAETCLRYIDAYASKACSDILCGYSLLHWTEHFREADVEFPSDIATLGYRLCTPDSESFKTWVVLTEGASPLENGFFPTDTPFLIASYFGLDAVLRQALDHRINDVNTCDSAFTRMGPLSWAIFQGHESVVRMLLDTGKVDLMSRDGCGSPPLAHAADKGDESVVELLLGTGMVDINSRDDFGETPLSAAALKGHDSVVKMLLDTGKVDIDSRDNEGRTPLASAVYWGYESVVKMLLATGKVDLESRDNDGQTQMALAAKGGNDSVVKLLLATGEVDLESRDNDGHTPMALAAKGGNDSVVKLLLATGEVDLESRNKQGQTLLALAAKGGNDSVVKLLLATGEVDLESRDNDGQTPLALAATAGWKRESVVKMLLDTGKVDINSQDSDGKTPLSRAAAEGYDKLVEMMLESKSK
ncbi:unnamed protein product [Penicillium olsonii]|nr:unnamed protein product [Penicillium olsonii]